MFSIVRKRLTNCKVPDMFKSHIRDLFYNHFGCLSPYENTLKYWRMAIGRTLERENTERERARAKEAKAEP